MSQSKDSIPSNMGFKSDPTADHYINQVGGTTDCYGAYRNKPKGQSNTKDVKVDDTKPGTLVRAHYRGVKHNPGGISE